MGSTEREIEKTLRKRVVEADNARHWARGAADSTKWRLPGVIFSGEHHSPEAQVALENRLERERSTAASADARYKAAKKELKQHRQRTRNGNGPRTSTVGEVLGDVGGSIFFWLVPVPLFLVAAAAVLYGTLIFLTNVYDFWVWADLAAIAILAGLLVVMWRRLVLPGFWDAGIVTVIAILAGAVHHNVRGDGVDLGTILLYAVTTVGAPVVGIAYLLIIVSRFDRHLTKLPAERLRGDQVLQARRAAKLSSSQR